MNSEVKQTKSRMQNVEYFKSLSKSTFSLPFAQRLRFRSAVS